MTNAFIAQMQPWFGAEEKEALVKYMDEGGWLTEFRNTTKFEEMIAAYTGAKHCIVTNNGTISLTLAALAAGIVAGDEVIVPNYTQIATPNSIKMFGAVPVFVDIEAETLCLNLELVKKAITPKTRAIMLVTANGRYPLAGIESFKRICQENNLVLIEDAAQSLGSSYPDGRHQGSVGLIGSFSFSAPKIVSTGQGGALITNSDDIASRLRRLKDFGRSAGGLDVHDSIGYNFKFTELQAVVGIEQMKKMPMRVERKKRMLIQYRSLLDGIQEISFFYQDVTCTTPWFIDVIVERREELITYLKSKGIGTRVMYPPINKQIAYQLPGEHAVSNKIGKQGLWLPSTTQLTEDQISYICENIRTFYKKNS